MADKTGAYPMLPSKAWWALRKQFIKALPKEVTSNYFSVALDMTEQSAKANVIPYLHTVGLIDDENKPTELAVAWRTNEKYKEVCQLIKSKVYDQELLDLFPSIVEDRAPIEQWFATKTRLGESASKRMASFYELLTKAEPSEGDEIPKKKPTTPKVKVIVEEHSTEMVANQVESDPVPKNRNQATVPIEIREQFPSLHIDIQVHISPDSSETQIDKVFESMAKHLKDLYSTPKKTE